MGEPDARPSPVSEGGTAAEGRGRTLLARLRSLPWEAWGWVASPTRRLRLVVALASTLALLGVVLYYTHGALLYGVDYSGTYSISVLLVQPHPDYLLPAVAVEVAGGNIYVGFYLAMGAGMFLGAYLVQVLAREFFLGACTEGELVAVEAFAALTYVFSPVELLLHYTSLFQATLLSVAGLLLFLVLLTRLWRRAVRGARLPRSEALAMAAAMVLSNPQSFPDAARVFGLELGGIALVLLAAAVLRRREHRSLRSVRDLFRREALYAVPFGVVAFLLELRSYLGSIAAVGGTVGQVASGYEGFSSPSYDPLPYVLRLVVARNFSLQSYSGWYAGTGAVAVAAYALPLLSLVAAPLVAWRLRRQLLARVAGLEVVLLLGVAWDSSSNPPLGPVVGPLEASVPLGPTLLPPGSFAVLLDSKFFPLLAGFSVVLIAGWMVRAIRGPAGAPGAFGGPNQGDDRPIAASSSTGRIRRAASRTLPAAFVLLVAGVVLFASLPIFDGAEFPRIGGEASPGQFLPSDYLQVEKILAGAGSNSVLLPSIQPYFETDWGYDGASSFYLDANVPSKVIVPAYWGAYAALLPQTAAIYSQDTQVILPGTLAPGNFSVAPQTYWFPDGFSSVYRTPAPLDLSNVSWLVVETAVRNVSEVRDLIAAGQLFLTVGNLTAENDTAWWAVGVGHASIDQLLPNGLLEVQVLLADPNALAFDASKVTTIALEVPNMNLSSDPGFGSLGVWQAPSSEVSPLWAQAMAAAGVQFLMVDASLLPETALDKPAYVTSCVRALEADGAVPVFLGSTLQLYRFA